MTCKGDSTARANTAGNLTSIIRCVISFLCPDEELSTVTPQRPGDATLVFRTRCSLSSYFVAPEEGRRCHIWMRAFWIQESALELLPESIGQRGATAHVAQQLGEILVYTLVFCSDRQEA